MEIETGVPKTWRAGPVAFLLYRVLWIAAFAAASYFAVFGQIANELRTQRLQKVSAELSMAAYLNSSAEGMLFGPFGLEGERAGFQEFDLLLAVDGKSLSGDRTTQIARLVGPAGRTVRLDVRHPDDSREIISVVRDPGRMARGYSGWAMPYELRRWIAFAITFVSSLASLVAALFLFLRSPRDRVAQSLSLALVLPLLLFGSLPPMVAMLINGVAYMLMVLAVLMFPDGQLRGGWQWLALGLTTAYLLFGFVSRFFAITQYFAVIQYFTAVFSVVPVLALLWAIVSRLRATPPGLKRQQTKFVLFGVALSCVFYALATGIAFLQAAPAVVRSLPLSSWVILATHITRALSDLTIPAGLLVSLLRFRLYDTETAISRSVVYGALTLTLLGIFAGSEKIIEVLIEGYFGEEVRALSGGIAAGITAMALGTLHHRISRWAERRFQGNLVNLRQGLPLLVADLRETTTPAMLGAAILARIDKGVRAAHGAVVREGETIAHEGLDPAALSAWLHTHDERRADSDRLHIDRDDPLFPMRVPLHADGVGLAGWLLLGPRPDGSFYGKDERDVLAVLADPIARALAIACERQARELRLENRLNAISARQDAFETALKNLQRPFGATGLALA